MRTASIKLILAALSLVAMSPTITHAAFDLIVDGGTERVPERLCKRISW
ncbi:MAG: hypothetical protein JO116_25040 [Planctomycetaceae bacterium]|nr:hypothetical protein [Planctomycetaceae bacterium]